MPANRRVNGIATRKVTLATSSPSPSPAMGFAYAGDLSKLYRAWTGDRIGELDTTTLTRLDGALRAALDL